MASHVHATGHIPPLSGGGLAELLYFSLIFGDADIASVPANVGFREKVEIARTFAMSANDPKRTLSSWRVVTHGSNRTFLLTFAAALSLRSRFLSRESEFSK